MPKRFDWTPSRLEALTLRFPKEGSLLLSQEFGLSRTSIENKAKALGVTSVRSFKIALNKCYLKEDYFEHWSPEMAYDLGNGFADGSVQLGSTPHYSLCVQQRDESIIIGTRQRLGSHHQLTRFETREESGNISKRTRCKITNKKIAVSLVEIHNLLPNKSNLDIPFPYVPPEFLPHFARGYLDGDGCVSYTQELDKTISSKRIYFKGSRQFVEALQDKIVSYVGIVPNKIEKDPTALTVHKICWGAFSDIQKLYNWLYPEGEYPFLQRKKEKLLFILTNF